MNFEIPEGLTDLLQDFTYEVLRKKPADLLSFAAQYFDELLEKRGGGDDQHRSLLAQLQSKVESNDDANSQTHSDEDDDDIMDMPNLPKHMLGANRRHSVAAEKYNPEEDTSDEPDIVHKKEKRERDFLRDTISDIFIFRSLETKQIDKVLDAMFGRECVEGDIIIEQGDDGDNFYIIESGIFDIFVNKAKVRIPN
jgi:cAMP-dependent protein kinase regulator